MNIKNKIGDIAARIKVDKVYAHEFSLDPVKAVTTFAGSDIPKDQVPKVIDGVKAKLIKDSKNNGIGDVKEKF